jgi:aryl-alcohol dehydrogenase-like predicted oxidoreductase
VAALIAISPIGYGAFKIGRNEGIKYENAYALPDLETTNGLLNGILDLGVNFIDTAPAYGMSEERIGQCIGHRRGEYVLATKVGEQFANGTSRYDFSRAGMVTSIQESLRRLRTDSVDLLWLHSTRDDLRVLRETDAADVMVQAKRAGWAKWIGLSGYTVQGFRAAFSWCDAIMVTYHAEDTSMAELIAEAAAKEIAVMVKKALASGKLPGPEAIRFVLSNPNVRSALVGSLSLEHVKENIAAARGIRNWAQRSKRLE